MLLLKIHFRNLFVEQRACDTALIMVQYTQQARPVQKTADLATRFERSLQSYTARTQYTAIGCSFQTQVERLASAASNQAEFWPLFAAVAKIMAKQHLNGTIQNIILGCATRCESPIELAMCFAIGLAARARDRAVLYDLGDATVYGDAEGEHTIRIQPQVSLGPYRVDLLVTFQTIDGPNDSPVVSSKQVVVECDGFEFHDRTKEQAIREVKRGFDE